MVHPRERPKQNDSLRGAQVDSSGAFGVQGTGLPFTDRVGGTHFQTGEGSVRFISENINLMTFIGLVTCGNGEVVSQF